MPLPLIDGLSALIVFGGTLLATLLRSGWRESALALRAALAAFGPGFSAERTRGELAAQVRAIREDGVLRARRRPVGDREFDEATDALIQHRSIPALLAAHEKHKARRLGEAALAMRVLAQSAELAPVCGMVGTLVALSRLPATSGPEAITGAVGMAVVTTLYGLLAANLVLAPLARKVERAARAEDAAREEVTEWIAAQVAEGMPHLRAAPVHHHHEAAA
ncbi:MotA/TolQ/ExbB proton channel family protein [Novosphingobium flavum]|uniref:MotA/TolQ/ExbB proton channel family protein n=1 Tax=Novosphingobium flavum TaxID=1778672 RepID=A0A7X1KLS8_9SPHN|nr:MotA/TolQ/ExbB proton channel family protein [Novosphingobium flavum]MBC2665623.1 MotA/TolQ/ExbB proton channel family protein [Novosphingobium flavum]